MKKFNLFILLFSIFNLLFTICSSAQAPQSFNYQLIARDTAGLVLSNRTIGIQISILQDAAGGTVVYSEQHTASTNGYGLVNLGVGTGSVVSGNFSSIDWGNHLHYLKLELDPTGGTSYFTMGATQLVSVPYALHAKTAENGFSGDYNDLVNPPSIPSNVSELTNDAGYLTSFTEVDGSVTNEIQALSISNDTIYLTDGGFIKLPAGFNGDYNSLSNQPFIPSNVSELTNDAGYLTTELQVLSISNDTIYLTNGGFVELPEGFSGDFNDLSNQPFIPSNTSELTNDAGFISSEVQVLSISNDTIYLTGGSFAKLPEINNITWQGTYGTPPTDPLLNDAYYDSVQNKSYVFDGSSWQILAQDGLNIEWLGPLDTFPVTGGVNQAFYHSLNEISYIFAGDVWQVLCRDGYDGLGIQGEQGLPGNDGANGVSLTWLGEYASVPDNPNINDAFYSTTDRRSYVWDGTYWQTLAMDGTDGAPGAAVNWLGGFSVTPSDPGLNDAYYDSTYRASFIYNGYSWQVFATDGTNGTDGIDGIDGNSLRWLGAFKYAPTAPEINDCYYDSLARASYLYDGSTWQLVALDGADGADGSDGASITWLGTMPSDPSDPLELYAYYNSTDNKSYIYQGSSWHVFAQDGPQGTQGAQGPAGTGLLNRGAWSADSTYTGSNFVFDRSTDNPAINSMWICQASAPFSSATHPYQDATNWVEFQASSGTGGSGNASINVTDGENYIPKLENDTTLAKSQIFDNGTNIGIGTESPGAKLEINSTAAITASTDGFLNVGISTNPHLTLDDSHIQAKMGANPSAISINKFGGNTLMNIDGGLIGVGTLDPSAKVHIKYNSADAAHSQLQLEESSGDWTRLGFHNAGVANDFWSLAAMPHSTTDSSSILNFYNGGTSSKNVMSLTGEGRVGIGTSDPDAALQITSLGSNEVPQLRLKQTNSDWSRMTYSNSTSNYWVLGALCNETSSNTRFTFYNPLGPNGGHILTMSANGYVGIGSYSPDTKLTVDFGTLSTTTGVHVRGASGTYDLWAMRLEYSTSPSYSHYIFNDADQGNNLALESKNGLSFNTNGANERIRITPEGNVGIGHSSPAAKLMVKSNSTMTAPQLFLFEDANDFARMTFSNNQSAKYWSIAGYLNDDNSLAKMNFFHSETGDVMTILGNGNVGIGTTNPTSKLMVNGRTTTNTISILGGSDFAEPFDVEEISVKPLPGMIVVIDSENAGKLEVSTLAYDKKVAGIISGANGIDPGIVMSHEGTIANGKYPVALSGRVYCYVDASYGAIEPGDLLTTSPTTGHAMKAGDYDKAKGAVIGKAMSSLPSGKGMVLVLVSLQ